MKPPMCGAAPTSALANGNVFGLSTLQANGPGRAACARNPARTNGGGGGVVDAEAVTAPTSGAGGGGFEQAAIASPAANTSARFTG